MKKPSQHIPVHAIKTKVMGPLGFAVIHLPGIEGKRYDSSIPHRHTFFELLMFKTGQGIHEIDFTRFPVESKSVHFVSPGQIHQLSLKKTKGFVLCFTEDFMSINSKERFVDSFPFFDPGVSPAMKLNKKMSLEIETLILSADEEIQLAEAADLDLVRSYFSTILLKLKSLYLRSGGQKANAHADKKQKVIGFKKLINATFLMHKSVSDYAGELHVSPNHLNSLCHKHEGKTATRLIHERMVLEAKRLLYGTELTTKEIAHQLNFADMAYFNRFFKKQTGSTPLEYRRQVLQIR